MLRPLLFNECMREGEEKIFSCILGASFRFSLYVLVSFYFAMAIIYISNLHTKLTTTNVENVKLLDGMHEGLLILSKKGR